ncbi:MAG: hypothetical protein OJF49_002482 [Ktedonobacterales bacterium]|nr:MAG: hypothetical protein OJF49_002482 [Ktedonobacterales bacterium]
MPSGVLRVRSVAPDPTPHLWRLDEIVAGNHAQRTATGV